MDTNDKTKAQIVILRATTDITADDPADWNWTELAGDPVEVVGAGPVEVVGDADALTSEEVDAVTAWTDEVDLSEIPDAVLAAIDLAMKVSAS